ncbi:MAG: hypothetical protein WC721_22490 [Victivallaceae bacterium]
MLTAVGAQASNYPSDYFNQNVRAISRGPAVVAQVSSGCMKKYVIGYKNNGMLVGADSVLLVIKAQCGYDSVETQMNLTKEWNGNGYLSYSINKSDICKGAPGSLIKLELAFNANGNWDPMQGANYTIYENELYEASPIKTADTGIDVGYNSWAAIVEQMKK